jgi:tRNA(Arg) A34 adenosine deaminase TadA
MHEEYIKEAISLSQQSVDVGGYPVGSIVVLNGKIIGRGLSDGKQKMDATSHSEIAAIRDASKNLNKRELLGATVYSSLEPCIMCLCACHYAKVSTIVYACLKKHVPPKYFEGTNKLEEINKLNTPPITLIHEESFQEEALKIFNNWELNRKKIK